MEGKANTRLARGGFLERTLVGWDGCQGGLGWGLVPESLLQPHELICGVAEAAVH